MDIDIYECREMVWYEEMVFSLLLLGKVGFLLILLCFSVFIVIVYILCMDFIYSFFFIY